MAATGHLGLAAFEVLVGDGGDVVEIVEVDVFEVAGCGLDVAGYGHVY